MYKLNRYALYGSGDSIIVRNVAYIMLPFEV